MAVFYNEAGCVSTPDVASGAAHDGKLGVGHAFDYVFSPAVFGFDDAAAPGVVAGLVCEEDGPAADVRFPGPGSVGEDGVHKKEDVASFRDRLADGAHVVVAGANAFGHTIIAFVASRDADEPSTARGYVVQLPDSADEFGMAAAVLEDVASGGREGFVAAVEGVPGRAFDRTEGGCPVAPIAAAHHPVEAADDGRVDEHFAEGIAIGFGQVKKAAEGGASGAPEAFGSPGEFFAHDNAIGEFVDGFVGPFQPFFVHDIAHDEVAGEIPEVEFFVVNASVGIGFVKRGVDNVRRFFQPGLFAIGIEAWRRVGGVFVSGLGEDGHMFGRQAIHPFRSGFWFCSWPVGLQDSAVGIFTGEETLWIAPFPGAEALKGGSGNDEQIASFEHGLFDQVHVVCACEEVFGRFYIAFVAGRNQDHAAVVRIDIAECPDDAYAVADAVVVLKVVGPGRISGFVVAL